MWHRIESNSVLTLRFGIPVVCIRLMGRVLQSVTQLSISNRWYVLDQPNYMFRPVEAIMRFVQVEL